MPIPSKRYLQLIQQGGFQADHEQQQALLELDRFYEELSLPQRRFGLLKRRRRLIRGIYLWGGVGRGKTWLMDLLFECLPASRLRRMHFHAFMQQVHRWLDEHAGKRDPLPRVAAKLARDTDVLFLDEFHVVDIGDAVILAQLLNGLFEQGISLVTTSNVLPEKLYNEGIQRASFLPAIALLETCTRVVHVAGVHDYRRRILEQETLYFHMQKEQVPSGFEDKFAELSRQQEIFADGYLDIAGRQLAYRFRGLDIIWFTFRAVCHGPRNASDYLEIARHFQTVLIEAVPAMDASQDDSARRFISLIDVFYDHRIKLLLSARVPLEKLYSGERLAFEFKRTISRLQEMQSGDYLSQAHQP